MHRIFLMKTIGDIAAIELQHKYNHHNNVVDMKIVNTIDPYEDDQSKVSQDEVPPTYGNP